MLTTTPGNGPLAGPSSRRAFLVTGALAAVGVALAALRRNARASSATPMPSSADVLIVSFDAHGKRLGAARVPKIVKSEAEWRAQLSAKAFDVTRHADTEYAFSGAYWNLHDAGLYRCVCCDTALFSAASKFDSGTGWPSFTEPLAKENVVEVVDKTFGMTRTAVSCARCDAHQGHVFPDGPPPGGLRYCINSVSLTFVKFA